MDSNVKEHQKSAARSAPFENLDFNMGLQKKVNQWVTIASSATVQLTYNIQVDPAPLTTSPPLYDPVKATLIFIITNNTAADILVDRITIDIPVGQGAGDLTPNSTSIIAAVDDTTDWEISPPSPTSNGIATYLLNSVTGGPVTIKKNSAIQVQLYQIATNSAPGTSNITINETISGTQATTTVSVTTYPFGFYFNSLQVNSSSTMTPVVQINYNDTVTLTWNTSIRAASAFKIYYCNRYTGQQIVQATEFNSWTSPPLTGDTVFLVEAAIQTSGGTQELITLPASVVVTPSDYGHILTNTIVVGNPNQLNLKGGNIDWTPDATLAYTQNLYIGNNTNNVDPNKPTPVKGFQILLGCGNIDAVVLGDYYSNNPVNGGATDLNIQGGSLKFSPVKNPQGGHVAGTIDGTAINGGITITGGTNLADGAHVTSGNFTVDNTITCGGLVTDTASIAGVTINESTFSGSAALTINGSLTLPYSTVMWVSNLNAPIVDQNAGVFYNASSKYCAIYAYNTITPASDPNTPNGSYVTGVASVVNSTTAWGFATNGSIGCATLYQNVNTHTGQMVVTPPVSIYAETHLSGSGQLEEGKAVIVFDSRTIDLVFHTEQTTYITLLTPTDPCCGLAVTLKCKDQFVVEELMNGKSNAKFDWFIISRRPSISELGATVALELPEKLPEIAAPISRGRADG